MTRATRIFVGNGREERGNVSRARGGFRLEKRSHGIREGIREGQREKGRKRERERERERGNGCVVAGVAKKEGRERRRMRSEDGRESRTRTTIWVSY